MNPCSRDYPVTFVNRECTVVGDRTQICNILAQSRGLTGTWTGSILDNGACPLGIGRHTLCTKTRWPEENLLPCCLGELDSETACASEWCPGSSICANALQTFCTENNGENILSSRCQTICLNPPDDSGRTRTWCDIASSEFCQQPENRNNPYCGCINSRNAPAVTCFDAACTAEGYRTRTLENDINECIKTPTNICQQVIECRNADTCNFNNVEFTSKCVQQTNITVPVKTEPVDTGITPEQNDMPLTPVTPVAIPTTQTKTETFNYTIIIIIIIIIVIVIIIIIIYYSYTGK